MIYNVVRFIISMHNKQLLLAEITLLLASVFIFRSVWLLTDRFEVMHKPTALLISLVISLVVTIPALRYIIRHNEKH
jgi:hypothetical protein